MESRCLVSQAKPCDRLIIKLMTDDSASLAFFVRRFPLSSLGASVRVFVPLTLVCLGVTSMSVSFKNGILIDGQHRLLALAMFDERKECEAFEQGMIEQDNFIVGEDGAQGDDFEEDEDDEDEDDDEDYFDDEDDDLDDDELDDEDDDLDDEDDDE